MSISVPYWLRLLLFRCLRNANGHNLSSASKLCPIKVHFLSRRHHICQHPCYLSSSHHQYYDANILLNNMPSLSPSHPSPFSLPSLTITLSPLVCFPSPSPPSTPSPFLPAGARGADTFKKQSGLCGDRLKWPPWISGQAVVAE